MYIQWIFYVKKYGCQIFDEKTNDGYINTLNRILAKSSANGETQNQTNKVIFLQQGILRMSAYYVIWFQEKSLGVIRYGIIFLKLCIFAI